MQVARSEQCGCVWARVGAAVRVGADQIWAGERRAAAIGHLSPQGRSAGDGLWEIDERREESMRGRRRNEMIHHVRTKGNEGREAEVVLTYVLSTENLRRRTVTTIL